MRDQKKRALFAHVSQDGEAIYRDHHGPMEEFRGREIAWRLPKPSSMLRDRAC